jgi:hypothetical protein
MIRIVLAGVVATAMLGGGTALAAGAAREPVRGTITARHGATLAITDSAGQDISLALAPGARVIDVIPASIADLKDGSYVGTAAIRQPDGTYRAMELQLFPASMRGVGLGTRAWNLAPHSTMTNGTVGRVSETNGTVGSVHTSGGLVLSVNDGSGEKRVLVPRNVPVVTYAPGSDADLRPGAHVLFFGAKAADGAYRADRISVGRNGLVPPM